MRKFLIIFVSFLCLIVIQSYSQSSNLELLTFQGTRIIKPSVNNLVLLLNSSNADFKSLITQNNFQFVTIEQGFDKYDNGYSSNRGTQTISKSTSGNAVMIEWQDLKNTSISQELIKELAPYHFKRLESGNELYKFTIEGVQIKILIGRVESWEGITISKI